MTKRISRNDVIVIIVILAVLAWVEILFSLNREKIGDTVIVTVDGETYGTYSLWEEQEVPIMIDGVERNYLVIRDGMADMTKADCPDKLCVHQRAISKTNETIVCLPNKVVVQIAGSKESEFDSIAK